MASQTRAIGRPQHSRVIERTPVFYGWMIWLVATIGIIGSAPGQAFTVSIFIDHYIAEFGMGRTMVSGLFGLGTFLAAFSLTWIGRQIDRRGTRQVGAVISGLFALVLVFVSMIAGPLTMFMSFIAIRMLGQGSMVLVSMSAIAQWWRHRRGWVVGLALVGFALFQTIYLRALQLLIENYGWRTTWVILGIAVGAVVLPLWWVLMRDRPEDYGLQPDATHYPLDAEGRIQDDVFPEENWTLAEALRVPIFWVFVSGRFLAAAWGTGMVFHQVSIITGHGYPAAAVAQAYGMLALVNAFATLGVGRYISRVRPGYVISGQLSLIMLVMLLAMSMTANWMLIAYAALFGVVMALGSTFDGVVWADLFGRMHHGAIRGFVTTALVAGTALGPIIYGLSYDLLGSYSPIMWFGGGLMLLPLIFSFFVNRPSRKRFSAVN